MSNVLLTCGGHWVGMVLQLKQAMQNVPALREGQLYVADRANITPAGCYADAAFRVPDVADPLYADRLLELCTEHRIRVIVPHLDIDLDRLVPDLERFAAIGTTVVCPSADVVDLCRDKLRFDAFARSEGLPCPTSYPVGSLQAEVFPLFAKRRRSSASVGACLCRSLEAARTALEQYPDLIFQEVLQGQEVSVDAFISSQGHCTIRVPRLRDKVVGGEAMQSHTIRSAPLANWADRTTSALARQGFRGPLNLQFFFGDMITLVEVNARLGSASVLANAATKGRYYSSVLFEACGGVSEGDPDDYQEGLYLYRYWGEMYHNNTLPVAFVPPR
jgi:carbamoyl-phosphate synthase large subunit